MSLRPWILGAFIIIGMGANGYLLAREQIAESEHQRKHRVKRTDPLVDLVYSRPKRKVNFEAFGLEGNALEYALMRVEDLDTETNRARLELFIDEVSDPDRLAHALCGVGQVRPRYAALEYLVTDKGGQREAVDIVRISRLERGEWATVSPIQAVYDEVEMGKVREPDATVMGLAAILSGRESDLLERKAPWGQGLGGRWSFEEVQEEHPGIENRVIEYLAVLHLIMEIATSGGGFCGE